MNNDLIRRSDALKAVDTRHEELLHHTEYRRKHCDIDLLGIKKHILAIPPVEARPQGEWKFDGWGTYCSECGYRPKIGCGKFCSECGAKMKGGAENEIDNEDFGILAVCSIRYCRGRQTYMPSLVRGIVKAHLSEISDKDLQVLINDCEYSLKWEDEIEPKEWAEWKNTLIAEQKRRKDGAE